MVDKKISELDAGGALDGTELVPVVQADETVKVPSSYFAHDLISALIAASVAVTGTVSLGSGSLGRAHVCSGTSADYTVTLYATGSGNVGAHAEFLIDHTCTKLITFDAGSGGTIYHSKGSSQTIVMWANEVALLRCIGAKAWQLVRSRTSQMLTQMKANTVQSVANNTPTKILLPVAAIDIGSLADTTNSKIIIRRAGDYDLSAYGTLDNAATGTGRFVVIVQKNGTTIVNQESFIGGSGADGNVILSTTVYGLVAGDYLELVLYQGTGSSKNTYAGSFPCFLSVKQLNPW